MFTRRENLHRWFAPVLPANETPQNHGDQRNLIGNSADEIADPAGKPPDAALKLLSAAIMAMRRRTHEFRKEPEATLSTPYLRRVIILAYSLRPGMLRRQWRR